MELSEYCLELEEPHKGRYISKIMCIACDPYLVKLEECSTNVADFPETLYPDIVAYLVHKTSAYTLEEMHAYKSLEAYNQAVCGWVRKVAVKQIGDNILVLGKVMHSQRLNEQLLSPWIITTRDGTVSDAHCNCVAGLGEVCTHVAAVLFAIDNVVRNREETTRTGKPAYWMPPTNRPAEPKLIKNIDFRSPKKRLRAEGSEYDRSKETESSISALSKAERTSFLKNLLPAKQTSAIHSITQPFAQDIAKELQEKKKFFMSSLFKKEYENLTLEELKKIGTSIDFSLTIEECKNINRETEGQFKTKKWYLYRGGRITASKFKNCCRSNPEQPSLSLIKSVCYPQTYKIKGKALSYGCDHENIARKQFEAIMQKKHENFDIEEIGLFINPKYPYFGASPDGVANCNCCGLTLVEIKCPFCARESGLLDKLEYKNFFLEISEGKIQLKENHQYYFQIQMQLALTQQTKCYLVVWSPKDLLYLEVFFNEEFWNREKVKAQMFFYDVILPEMLGKYFTRKDTSEPTEEQCTEWDDLRGEFYEEVVETESEVPASIVQPGPSKPVLYCICQKEDDGVTPMIACDSETCRTKWFHFSCVGLEAVPRGIWLCSDCKSDEEN